VTARTPELSGPQGSRETRRRLSLDPIAAAPGASPWTRSYEAWRRSGLTWEDPGDANSVPADGEPVTRVRATPTIHLIAEPAPDAAKTAPKPRPKPKPRSKPKPRPKPEPKRSSRTRTLSRPNGRAVLALAAGGALVIGFAAYAITSGEDEGRAEATPGALPAGNLFAVDRAATADGLTQQLTAIAADGGTVAAAGAEAAGDGGARRARAEFLTSTDGGRTWRLARVRAADGSEPAPGERPRLLAGGKGAWVAIGAGTSETPVWTSTDALTWTRQAPGTGAPFGPKDRVSGLARTATGFVAVGATSPSGRFVSDARGVVWTSPDGHAWQRADRLSDATIAGLDGVAAAGNVLVAHGTFRKTVTKTVERKGKKRKVDQTVRGDAAWRSADGGRTWTWVNVPQGQGSYGPMKGPAAGPGGFYLAREGRRTTGGKKHRKTERFGVVFGSADGSSWTPYAQVGVPQYVSLDRIGGSAAGLAVLVLGQDDQNALLRSTNGRIWQPSAESGGRGTIGGGLTVVEGGSPALVGRRGDDGYLSLLGQPVDLTKVAGFERSERAVTAIAPGAGGRMVAVGSTNGNAASWATAGATWTRSPSLGPGRLTDVAYGPQGWLAVGNTGVRNGGRPLVAASSDGSAWKRSPIPGGGAPSAVAAGASGYVAVGRDGDSAAVWQSPDLRRWTRGGNAGRGDLDGGKWMSDVTAVSKGYVAVGGRGDGKPAAWTSPDGLKWTAVPQPPGTGTFDRVAARGDLLVATGSGGAATTGSGSPAATGSGGASATSSGSPVPTGTSGAVAGGSGGAPFVAVSSDGGRSWRASVPTGAPEATVLTGLTTTTKGFLVAGAAGALGRQDVVLWTSQDGAAWRQVPARGSGLDGPGDQRLTALTASGDDLVAVGLTADHRGETPTLWRTMAP
jgi:hypothetical protein